MQALILTLFPEMFPGTLGHSLAGKALDKGLWSCEAMQIRDFATDKHRSVDGKSYGGGTGLVMRADVVGAAIDAAQGRLPHAQLVYLTPRGVPLTQALVEQLALGNACESAPTQGLIIICGRYEGVDQRVLDHYKPLEISLGDYVLSGGEIAAQVLLDACIRLIPGVISTDGALEQESFTMHAPSASKNQPIFMDISKKTARLLEYPQYSAPPDWRGLAVPKTLLSGDHQAIAAWRMQQSQEITSARRPDLLDKNEK